MKKDKLHYSPRKLDSYNKPYNFITSPRECGKTQAILATKLYKTWAHEGRPSIVLRRQIIDITSTYIDDLNDSINDFLPEHKRIKFEYNKGTIKEGVVDVKVNGTDFCRFIALSCPKARIKSLHYEDPKYIIFDEFIVDNRGGEAYLKDEANKFKEIYNTFNRFATRHGHIIKCYFCGNPYSIYNPYYVWLGVDLSLIKPGAFLVGRNYAIECAELKPELAEWIRKMNPLYEFDDSYTRYAFGALSINDANIRLVPKQPQDYKLRYIFRLQNRYLYIYYKALDRKDRLTTDFGKYWIEVKDNYIGQKGVYAADFNNLVDGSRLATAELSMIMLRLKQCIGNRDVSYKSIDAGYLTEEIYKLIK